MSHRSPGPRTAPAVWGPGASSTVLHRASTALVQGLTRSIAVHPGPAVRRDVVQPGGIMTGMSDLAPAGAPRCTLDGGPPATSPVHPGPS